MILKVNKDKSALLTEMEDFLIGYRAKKWLEDHIHLYEQFDGDNEGLFREVVKDYFAEQKEYYSLLSFPGGIYITCYEIRFAVILKDSLVLFNTHDEAVAFYCDSAKVLLQDNYSFKNYKEKIDFSVLKTMIKQYKMDLKIILGG